MGFNSTLITVGLLATLVSLGLVSFMMSNISASGVAVDDEYTSMFQNYEANNEVYLTQQEIIEGGEINPEGQDLAVTKDVIISFKSIQSAGEVTVNMTRKMGNTMGISAGVMSVIFALILLGSLLGVFYAITGRKP